MHAFLINTHAQQIHTQRRKAILQRYPAVRGLFGPYPWSAPLLAGLVALQWTVAWLLRAQPWYVRVLVAYGAGAILNHALYVLMHEATHNLIFSTPVWNKVCGLLCDWALGVPSAMSFRKYHLLHHHHLNERGWDPDVVSPCEGRLIGHGPLRKTLWLAGLSVSQALRPLKVPGRAGLDRWMWGNIAMQVGGELSALAGWRVGGAAVCLPLDLFCVRLASVRRSLAARAL